MARGRIHPGSSSGGAPAARCASAGGPRSPEGARWRQPGGPRGSSCRARGRVGPRAAAGHPKPAAAPGHAPIAAVRAFVAILLEDAVQRELGETIERLRPVARDVAWIAPGNLHLTLKFLGSVPEARIDSIAGALSEASLGAHPFTARIRGLGAFPSAGRPRVAWAGVTEGASEMIDLARRIDAALAGLGFPRDERPFSPHVTLGRVRRPGRNPALTDALGSATAHEFGQMRVLSVSLMRSELGPRGARYTALATVSLGRPVSDSGH
ncbi:MAG: RNA 2',3'-cyclic phosphodiesterase [Candidatus Rokuibacteriota bacterium]|nr:MAG: RNA 2',3'-cyclic phosphodiesterase [Candidatus Rokubacteria bacterium]